ncbi:glycosyltransferase [Niastella caeni]|uniref:Glycosyltransferase n=1 Tax=Niastella caeni TaxID=2569763 RepID=A0A4S8I0I2_9BACT|nr:glycosyltransferase [Niastella caeni]THU41517.1 glycosyltransferase [Niastella caeni]
MYKLENKTILILSPEGWGAMFLSKHHYAVELAKAGNTVYFLNPPSVLAGSKKIQIRNSGVHENLFFIEHQLAFPFRLRFHAISLFHFFMRGHIRKILRSMPAPVDIVWSFDLLHLYPLDFFDKSSIKVFHPVDEPLQPAALKAAAGADIIFSVTNEILNKYKFCNLPSFFVHHGVSPLFFRENGMVVKNDPVKVGLSGNLLRKDIDRNILLTIIQQNPQIVFECWGSYEVKQSNIGGDTELSGIAFIDTLKSMPNVILHGTAKTEKLAMELHRMDAFLICYDVNKDQSRGTNYHKIMEYMATGKVIISNNVTTFKDYPDYVQMIPERNNNDQLPVLFNKVIRNLETYNDISLQKKRIAFARTNMYDKHISTIANHIGSISKAKS